MFNAEKSPQDCENMLRHRTGNIYFVSLRTALEIIQLRLYTSALFSYVHFDCMLVPRALTRKYTFTFSSVEALPVFMKPLYA